MNLRTSTRGLPKTPHHPVCGSLGKPSRQQDLGGTVLKPETSVQDTRYAGCGGCMGLYRYRIGAPGFYDERPSEESPTSMPSGPSVVSPLN